MAASSRGGSNHANCQHSARNRQFYTLPSDLSVANDEGLAANLKDGTSLLHTISESVIGKGKIFNGPFGPRQVVYLDYIASGRSLSFIEDYIREEVLPEYGNTHTTTSVTSLQTTLYRHEARDIVRNAVNASEHDAVLFVGSGCTGAIHKLIHGLHLCQPPVVFVGPFEHHSNLLPWRELGALVIQITEDLSGLTVDIGHLTSELEMWESSGRQMIGCFSAASNITGLLTDVNAVTICLHKHGALAFWDFATAAPYVKVDMNPVITSEDQPFVYKDAIFMSVHKFIGGVSTPGVLVAKKKLFISDSPECCGGGSVFFVSKESHRYLQEPELREEAGTPPIVGSIRAGLVFQLKEAVGHKVIMDREQCLCQRAMAEWKDCPGLVILGNESTNRLPVFSFLIHHGNSRMFLHYNYVSALLNDVFGIQARGGCACAGPYAQSLLGMDEELAQKYENLLSEDRRLDRTHLRRYTEYSDREVLRPGFTRINLPYFMNDEELEFVIEAIKMVASDGWRLLPLYMFNVQTGEWRARHHQIFKDRKWLGHITYSSGQMKYRDPFKMKGELPINFNDCLLKARECFAQSEKTSLDLPDHTVMFDEEVKLFRWFLLPSEALRYLRDQGQGNMAGQGHAIPFCPGKLRKKLGLHLNKVPSSMPSSSENAKFHDFMKEMQTDKSEIKEEMDKDAEQLNWMDTNDGQTCLPYSSINNARPVSHSGADSNSFSSGMERILEKGYVCTMEENLSDPKLVDSSSGAIPILCNSIAGRSSQNGKNPDLPTENLSLTRISKDERLGMSIDVSRGLDRNTISQCMEGSADQSTCRTTSNTIPALKTGTTTHSREPREHGHSANVLEFQISLCGGSQADNMAKGKSAGRMEDDSKAEICKTGMCPILKRKDVKPKVEVRPTKLKWHSPWKKIFKPFVEAVNEYGMFHNGDRVLVCLSGGKDSLSLLHTVRQYQFYSRSKGIQFEFGAVTVDPQTPSYDPSPLKDYLAALDVPYFYESQGIMESAAGLDYECASICSFCSRMKRGRIYACARREGYNVLTLGQHLDDLSESFLMSFFHNGTLRTMKACYSVQEGDLRVIRPFVYVREKDLRDFAEKNKLPVIAENCPACFEAPKERHRIKQMLASQEILHPRVYSSMMAAMKPIMAINKTGLNIHKLLQGVHNVEEAEHDLNL